MSLAIGPLARSTRAKCNGAVFFHRRRPCCGHSSVRSRGPADPTRLNCVSHDSSTCSEKWFHKSNSKRDRVFPTFLSESSQYGWTNLASLREHVRSKRCAATPPRGHRPFYVGSRARGHSGGTLVGGRMTSAPSFHSLRTRCAAYGDDRRDTSLSGRLTCVQALAKLCRFASEPRARPNVWPEPRSGGPEGREVRVGRGRHKITEF